MSISVGMTHVRPCCLVVKRATLPFTQWRQRHQLINIWLAQTPALQQLSSRRLKSTSTTPDATSMKFPLKEQKEGDTAAAAGSEEPNDKPLPWMSSAASAMDARRYIHGQKPPKNRFRSSPQYSIITLSMLGWVFYMICFHDEQETAEKIDAGLYPALGGPKLELHDLESKIRIRRWLGKETILEEYRMAEIKEMMELQHKRNRKVYPVKPIENKAE